MVLSYGKFSIGNCVIELPFSVKRERFGNSEYSKKLMSVMLVYNISNSETLLSLKIGRTVQSKTTFSIVSNLRASNLKQLK